MGAVKRLPILHHSADYMFDFLFAFLRTKAFGAGIRCGRPLLFGGCVCLVSRIMASDVWSAVGIIEGFCLMSAARVMTADMCSVGNVH